MIEYKEGDRVYIVTDPAVHKAMPHRRYHGKVGVVVGRRGRAYIVHVKLGRKIKTLFLLPEHMRPAFPLEERIANMTKKYLELIERSKESRKIMMKVLNEIKKIQTTG